MAKAEIGDRVTQYCPGIWQVAETHTNYATFSYYLNPGAKRPKTVHKGDITGTIVVMPGAQKAWFHLESHP